jgi:predicted kinase
MQLVVLVGLQACGKSSFCRERLYGSHVRLSLDLLKTRHREAILFDACLRAKQAVVLDNTNPTRADRARYIAPARAAGFEVVGYYFRSVIAECLARNDARAAAQRIPARGVLGTAGRLELPALDEGFDLLYYVRLEDHGENRGFEISEWQP